ncbi:MAG: AB hydrolase-1 domain-containing protein [Burkholderia sp.]|jgi:pimeloyl-ACP methyl ester carboxylesterase
MKKSLVLLAALAAFAAAAASGAEPLSLKTQGMFSSGGTVTAPLPGSFNEKENWLDFKRGGNTAHVDHANVLYQIPASDNGHPIVWLHGFGQSRMGWLTTPDGREGWATLFLRDGYPAFLVDEPRHGEAGSAAEMSSEPIDALGGSSKRYTPGDQAWYTHFRIGRVLPERYKGSQFPQGEEALNQFLRQATPNTGAFDLKVNAAALSAVMRDVKRITGHKAIYVTHSRGGHIGWATDFENVAAIVALEPGGVPAAGSADYKRLLAAKVPVAIYFGDYIDNGPEDLKTTAFWRRAKSDAQKFAEAYRRDGGTAVVVSLPDIGIRGNSHFLFQERNSETIMRHVEKWLAAQGLK